MYTRYYAHTIQYIHDYYTFLFSYVHIPEEGKLLPCHKRVVHQTWKLGSHQAQAGQGTGQVVAG